MLVAGATHPFADWRKQEIYPDERYRSRSRRPADRSPAPTSSSASTSTSASKTAKRPSALMNTMRYFLPHILALSTNSPFWRGDEHRPEELSRQGLRQISTHEHPRRLRQLQLSFEDFVNVLIKTNCLDNAKKIWWDIRPHPFFNTIEVRVCDLPMRAEETLVHRRPHPGDRGQDLSTPRCAIRTSVTTPARC